MDAEYLMGSQSVLVRTVAEAVQPTVVSGRLLRSLRKKAMVEAFGFFAAFFGKDLSSPDYDGLVCEYEQELSHAKGLGLFRPGGIREKDHLAFWCLGRVFEPEVYIESGVYIGSSLHAFIKCPGLSKVIAIDPNLTQLAIPRPEIPGAVLVDDRDFSQLDIAEASRRVLAYFDDHINTAERIQQAHQKGIRYLMFDDSTGFEGIAQRLYPAIPTIPMIMHCDAFSPGDEMSWSFSVPSGNGGWWPRVSRRITGQKQAEVTRLTLTMTEELISACMQTQRLIRKCQKVPDLGQFIPQTSPEKLVDVSKYLVELV